MGLNFKRAPWDSVYGHLHLYPQSADPLSLMLKIKSIKCIKKKRSKRQGELLPQIQISEVNNSDF